MSEEQPLLITPAEAARLLGIADDPRIKHPERTVREMARRGELRRVPIGRVTMIERKSLDDLIGGQ